MPIDRTSEALFGKTRHAVLALLFGRPDILGGRRVDPATPEILQNPYRRAAVLRDLTLLYAA